MLSLHHPASLLNANTNCNSPVMFSAITFLFSFKACPPRVAAIFKNTLQNLPVDYRHCSYTNRNATDEREEGIIKRP